MNRWLVLAVALLPNTGCLYYAYPGLAHVPELKVENRDGSVKAFRVDIDRTERPPLADDPPNPIDPPPGCRFKARCSYAEDVCGKLDPVLASGGHAHHIACLMLKRGSGHSKAAHAG